MFWVVEAHADWVRFSENELGDIFFYDSASTKKDSHPIVWILINYHRPVRVDKSVIQSAKLMTQIYCKDKSVRELAVFEYSGINGEGKLVRSSESGSLWTPVAKESPEEDLSQILCGK